MMLKKLHFYSRGVGTLRVPTKIENEFLFSLIQTMDHYYPRHFQPDCVEYWQASVQYLAYSISNSFFLPATILYFLFCQFNLEWFASITHFSMMQVWGIIYRTSSNFADYEDTLFWFIVCTIGEFM